MSVDPRLPVTPRANLEWSLPAPPETSEGIRLYWAPTDLPALRQRLLQLGFAVSEIEERHYGQTEFFVTDDDGYAHCFGVATARGDIARPG